MNFFFRKLRAISLIEISIGLMITGLFTAMALRGMAYVHKTKLLATANQIVIMRELCYPGIQSEHLAKRMYDAKCNVAEDRIDPPVCGERFEIDTNQIIFYAQSDADCHEIAAIVSRRLLKQYLAEKKKLTITID